MYGTPTWRASRMCSRVCGIGPSAARHHQDGAVHLRRAGDHVLHVVGVARAVDVRVVAVLGLVLHVRGGDGDAALALLRRLVDLVVREERRAARLRQHLGDGRRQRRLAVVNVPDGPDVHVGLVALELFLAHCRSSLELKWSPDPGLNWRPHPYQGCALPTELSGLAAVLHTTRWSGKRDSNPRHSAWKADALPTELFPRVAEWRGLDSNQRRRRAGRFTVCSLWPLGYPSMILTSFDCCLPTPSASDPHPRPRPTWPAAGFEPATY